MTDVDFRKAYAEEVKASAESKKRCNDLIEWTEQQRQTAIAGHAGQVRNTLAFKAELDLLVDALRTLDTLLDFSDDALENVWTFDDLTSIQAAFNKAKAALDQVTGDVGGSPR